MFFLPSPPRTPDYLPDFFKSRDEPTSDTKEKSASEKKLFLTSDPVDELSTSL